MKMVVRAVDVAATYILISSRENKPQEMEGAEEVEELDFGKICIQKGIIRLHKQKKWSIKQ